MKIVQIAPFYLPVTGGMEKIVKTLSEGLAKRGHEVTVLTHNINRQGGKNVFPPIEKINKVKVKRVTPLFKIHYGSYSPGIRNILLEENADVVHVHGYRHPHMEQACRVENGSESIVLLQGHSPFYPKEVTPFLPWLWYQVYDKVAKYTVFRMADHIIALTPYEKKELVERGCKPGKISIVQNPLPDLEEILEKIEKTGRGEIKEFRNKHGLSGEPLILYLGRIAQSKRIDLLVSALPYLIDREEDIELVIAGKDEGVAEDILHLAEKIGVRKHVKYMGSVTEKEKTLLYLSSNVYVLPSAYEGFGLTLLEAQAHDLPVVAMSGGGQEFAVESGKIVDKPCPEDIAESIFKTINIDNKADFDLEKHSPNNYVEKIEKTYERIKN